MALTSEEIVSRLAKQPLKSAIKERNGQKYLAISYVEKLLDTLFTPFGWQITNFQVVTAVNEVCGSLQLQIRNPDTGEWVSRLGTGAVQIQMKSGSTALNVESKIVNAMEKMYPKLKADCTRNAAKGLGKAFGRDLGRKAADVEPLSQMENDYLQGFKDMTNGVTSIEEIQSKFRALPESFQSSFDFKQVLNQRVEFAQLSHQKQLAQ